MGSNLNLFYFRAFQISWFSDYLFWHLSFEFIFSAYLDPFRVTIKPPLLGVAANFFQFFQ